MNIKKNFSGRKSTFLNFGTYLGHISKLNRNSAWQPRNSHSATQKTYRNPKLPRGPRKKYSEAPGLLGESKIVAI